MTSDELVKILVLIYDRLYLGPFKKEDERLTEQKVKTVKFKKLKKQLHWAILR